MKIYKPAYTKPLPAGAKPVARKGAKHRGMKFIKFIDRRGRTREARLTKKGDRILLEATHWWIEFEDNDLIARRIKAYPDEESTKTLKVVIKDLLHCKKHGIQPQPDTELYQYIQRLPEQIRHDLIRFGLLDEAWENSEPKYTLHELIEEFRQFMLTRERTARYIKEVIAAVKRVFDGCGFTKWADISPNKVQSYLDGLRDRGSGISKRRYNGLLQAVRQFCKWAAKKSHVTSSPLDCLEGFEHIDTDKRWERRTLDRKELIRFLNTTKTGPVRFGLTGAERNLIYRFTVETGFRRSEIMRLRVQDFDFDERTVTIESRYAKNRHTWEQPLRPLLAMELKKYMANKIASAKAFKLPDKTAKMLRADLEAANISYWKDGKVFDYHGLRHQFCTELGENPEVSDSTRQELMRHRTATMTARYNHTRLRVKRAAIEALPDYSVSIEKGSQANAG